jgi:L-amino acid N-acyltransferase YncA
MAVTVRDATSTDLPAILAIHNSTIDAPDRVVRGPPGRW